MRRNNLLWVIIFASMTVCLMLPLVLMGWLNYLSSRELARREITGTTLPLVRDNIYSEIHTDLLEPINVATTMANDSFLKGWASSGEKDVGQITSYLYQIQRKYKYFSVFFVSAKTLNYYHFKGHHKIISKDDEHDIWFYNFIDKGKEYTLDVDTNEASGNELTIFLNFRVENEKNELLGVTGVGMKMDTVSRLLEVTGNKYGRQVYLIDRKGEVQAHSDLSMIHKAHIPSMSGISSISGEILSSLDHVTDLEYNTEKGHMYVTSRYMPELKWFLVVEQNEDHALSGARGNLMRTVLFGIIIWGFLLVIFILSAHKYHSRLKHMARIDELTGLGNRRQFEEDFSQAVSRFNRNGESICLILMDLDGFKAVNDQVGHLAGDKLLKGVADAIGRVIRPSDRPARWGGDEFAILAQCELTCALKLAERVRLAVKEEALDQSESIGDARGEVSVSCGVVAYSNHASVESMLHEADQLLYCCKESGGNCVKGTQI